MRDASSAWKKILLEGFDTRADLLAYLGLSHLPQSSEAEKQFKTKVPRSFADRMQKGNRNDPLLLQVLPLEKELMVDAAYSQDPLNELVSIPQKGLIHKYQGRVLLTLTGSCAVNCRYCFRRHFPYQDNNPGRAGWTGALDYIRSNEEIHEVILSGGDPLLATDEHLAQLIASLESIPHVNTLRFHSRIPVVLPLRINAPFVSMLQQSRLAKVMVLHCNHPQELDESVKEACIKLKNADCHLLNQAVLLAKINDNPEILAALSQKLFAFGVLPYYLHLLDKVQGAKHFDIPHARALAIFRELQTLLPGYLVPRLSAELPGRKSKTLFI